MVWLLEIGILVMVALVLRRALHMGRSISPQGFVPRRSRGSNNSPVYSSLASEFEAHSAVLGVMLNDAMEEQIAGRCDLALPMLDLFGSEWKRLVNLLVNVQSLSLKYLPIVQYPIDARTLNARSFRSQVLGEFFRDHEVLDEFVFRSKLRFQLHLRLLERAAAVLDESFQEVHRDAGKDSGLYNWALSQLDLYFHDLDLLTKETLLGFSSELASLPDSAVKEMAGEIAVLTSTGSALSPVASIAHR